MSVSGSSIADCLTMLPSASQTLDSAWCRHEVDEARAYEIPIICVVDVDRQLQREVIDCYMEKGLSWLFDEQASFALIPVFFRLSISPLCISGYLFQHSKQVISSSTSRNFSV